MEGLGQGRAKWAPEQGKGGSTGTILGALESNLAGAMTQLLLAAKMAPLAGMALPSSRVPGRRSPEKKAMAKANGTLSTAVPCPSSWARTASGTKVHRCWSSSRARHAPAVRDSHFF